ncbi:hypothetical protein C8R43DRAFT_966302 [Mycena crocata]|nr:hypothetical protein C8R43DRAFT_966302 [Mycena crocata]
MEDIRAENSWGEEFLAALLYDEEADPFLDDEPVLNHYCIVCVFTTLQAAKNCASRPVKFKGRSFVAHMFRRRRRRRMYFCERSEAILNLAHVTCGGGEARHAQQTGKNEEALWACPFRKEWLKIVQFRDVLLHVVPFGGIFLSRSGSTEIPTTFALRLSGQKGGPNQEQAGTVPTYIASKSITIDGDPQSQGGKDPHPGTPSSPENIMYRPRYLRYMKSFNRKTYRAVR